jgi:hypothetical protein
MQDTERIGAAAKPDPSAYVESPGNSHMAQGLEQSAWRLSWGYRMAGQPEGYHREPQSRTQITTDNQAASVDSHQNRPFTTAHANSTGYVVGSILLK